MPDKVLDDTFVELTNAFGSSGITFKKLPVDLGRPGYLEIIARATAGLDITLVFNNAGYILTGFFDKTPLDRIMANVECNALAGVQISHHFVTQMIQKKQRGAICFTSSAAHNMPAPFSVMYASTKARKGRGREGGEMPIGIRGPAPSDAVFGIGIVPLMGHRPMPGHVVGIRRRGGRLEGPAGWRVPSQLPCPRIHSRPVPTGTTRPFFPHPASSPLACSSTSLPPSPLLITRGGPPPPTPACGERSI